MVLFDTNMILRYLLNDNQQMADQAERLLNHEDVAVTVEVIAEVIYVLKGVYAVQRSQIVQTVKRFLELVHCPEMSVLLSALDTFEKHNLDFVDCVLYGYHQVKGFDIATFDKKLLKLLVTASK